MTIPSTPATLPTLRQSVRDLLNEFDAADGLATYYGLYHDPQRTTLFVHQDGDGRVDGFLARCQTGFDLFRPLVTLRVRGDAAVGPLIEQALAPNRPYLLVVPAPLVERVTPHLEMTNPIRNRVYRFDPRQFQAEMNAMVVSKPGPDGHPRAEIRAGGHLAASAGINWRSPIFAEMYVHVLPEYQGRGWGASVVNSVVGDLLKARVTPLYNAGEDNGASQALAEHVGFVDTGAREVVAQGVRIV